MRDALNVVYNKIILEFLTPLGEDEPGIFTYMKNHTKSNVPLKSYGPTFTILFLQMGGSTWMVVFDGKSM